MAYIDDLAAPRARKRPVIGGVQTPDPVSVGYQGPSPVDVGGNPNDAYDGNTGIRPPRIPPIPTPPPITPPAPVPPMGPDNNGGGGGQTAQPRPSPAPAPAPQTINFQQALNDLYRKYFYRAPHADELQAHITGLTQGYGTLQGIEAELAREQQRLGLNPQVPRMVLGSTSIRTGTRTSSRAPRRRSTKCGRQSRGSIRVRASRRKSWRS
jgi:hypothetical protein